MANMTKECYVDELDFGHKMAIRLAVVQAFRFVLCNIKLWISWKRGSNCWLSCAPTLMYILSLTNYIIIPLLSLCWFAWRFEKLTESVYGVYCGTVGIIWLLQILFYFRIIKPYVYFNEMAYIASRKLAWERKEKENLSRSENLNGTVDFPNNSQNTSNSGNNNSASKESMVGRPNGFFPTDQGQFDGNAPFPNDPATLYANYMPDSPPSPPRKNKVEDSFVDQNDPHVQYTDRPRSYGDGEIRIGSYLNLNEDIYSLGFASLAKNEHIDEVLLEEEAQRPKASFMPTKTPRGGFQMPKPLEVDDAYDEGLDQDDTIYEDERK